MPLNITPQKIANMRALLIEQFNLFARACNLESTPILIPCPTCQANPVGDQNANFYLTGGNFNSLGDCPDCGGSHSIEKVSNQTINLVIDWKPKRWVTSEKIEIRVPDGVISTRGLLTDWPKVQQCNRMSVINIEGLEDTWFSLLSEGVDQNNMFSGTFFTCLWQRN